MLAVQAEHHFTRSIVAPVSLTDWAAVRHGSAVDGNLEMALAAVLAVFTVLEVEVEASGGPPAITRITSSAKTTPPAAASPKSVERSGKPSAAESLSLAEGEIAIRAPMPGMIIDYKVKEGDTVKSGDTVLVLEAMKMENALTSPGDGVIKKIHVHAGSSVSKDEVLCVIDAQK